MACGRFKGGSPARTIWRRAFELIPNPDGTTTLRGATWYRLRIGPTAYWSAWTQTFLHAIHMRVLRHIQRVSESPPAHTASAAAQPEWMATMNETCACTQHAP